MAVSAGLAVLGCVVFATAASPTSMITARILMGLGCSSFFMAPLTIYTRWFASDRFATLTGIQLGLGSLGTLAATAPLAMAVAAIGWRASFMTVAVLAAVIGVIVILIARDNPPGTVICDKKKDSFSQSLAGVGEVIRQKDLAPLFALHFTAYPMFAAVLGLWGGPFLSDIYGFDLAERGSALFIMAAAQISGLFIWGPVDRLLGSRKKPVMLGAVISALALIVFAFVPLSRWGLYLTMAVFGFSCAYTPVLTAHGRALFPHRLVGRGITFLNMGSMGGAFALQALTGAVVGYFSPPGTATPLAAYQAGFSVIILLLALALLLYLRTRDIPPMQTVPLSARQR
jgi:MFS family permease